MGGDWASLDGVIREGFSEEVTFEQRPRGKGVNPLNIWEKGTPDRGNDMCKGPVAGVCLTCSKKGREASVANGVGEGRREERKLARWSGHRRPFGARERLPTSCSAIWEPLEDFN